jgi:hypothetical protein
MHIIHSSLSLNDDIWLESYSTPHIFSKCAMKSKDSSNSSCLSDSGQDKSDGIVVVGFRFVFRVHVVQSVLTLKRVRPHPGWSFSLAKAKILLEVSCIKPMALSATFSGESIWLLVRLLVFVLMIIVD